MNDFIIRNEQTCDYRDVEELHRKAFWNLYIPGCDEHYLAHILRTHEDFVPELDYVCELNGQVIANVIFGNPDNYVARGFRSCKRYNICLEGDIFPAALLVKELKENFFDGRKYYFYESSAYKVSQKEAEAFDAGFEYRKKEFQPSQEEFFIHSHAIMR